mgnify:CR=1 FL=1
MKRQKTGKLRQVKVLYTTHMKKQGSLQTPVYTQNPRISLEGKWLEELGFHIGDRILLECGDGYINIRPAGDWGQAAMVCEASEVYALKENAEDVQGNPDGKEV